MFWTPRLCRICASVGTISYPIFSNLAAESMEAKFKKCFQINVYKDDFKPKEICGDCLNKLEEFCSFLDLCVASNNKFESIIYQTNRTELQETNWQNRIELFSPQVNDETSVIVKNNDTHISDINLETFEQTQNQTVLRHSSEFYATELFDYVDSYPVEGAASDGGKKKFHCTECGKVFVRKLTLKAHMSSHTNVRPFKCDVCGKSFPLRWILAGHMKLHTKQHQCGYCSKTFEVASKLERHVRTHTNDKPFACAEAGCTARFSDKRNLDGHMVSHSKERNFDCDICKRKYKSRKRLKDHQKAHMDVSHECELCGKSFKWRTNLLSHLKKHTGFCCRKCRVDFKNENEFAKHREECRSESVVVTNVNCL